MYRAPPAALLIAVAELSLTTELILARLGDSHPRVREHAVRLSERILHESPAVRAKLYTMAHDDDLRVRYQLAFTLGDITGVQATEALAAISKSACAAPMAC